MEKMLETIRSALAGIPKVPYPDTQISQTSSAEENLAQLFIQNLEDVPGPNTAEIVDTENSLIQKLSPYIKDLPDSELLIQHENMKNPERRFHKIGITGALHLIADTGTTVIDLPTPEAGYPSLLVDTHIVITEEKNILKDLQTLFTKLSSSLHNNKEKKYQVMITGTSRTADIEKMLVIPAHGPQEVRVFITRFPVNIGELAIKCSSTT